VINIEDRVSCLRSRGAACCARLLIRDIFWIFLILQPFQRVFFYIKPDRIELLLVSDMFIEIPLPYRSTNRIPEFIYHYSRLRFKVENYPAEARHFIFVFFCIFNPNHCV